MGLYRNIAGLNNYQLGEQVGLSIIRPPTNFEDYAADRSATLQSLSDASHAETISRYDTLLNLSLYDITKAGYFLVDGSIFQWTDAAHTQSVGYLMLMDVQYVENLRGTAGTMYMHLNEPVLAKDTAGYAGGSSASSGSTTTVSEPIAEVTNLPIPPSGPDVIVDYNPPVFTQPSFTDRDAEQPPPTSGGTIPIVTTPAKIDSKLPLIAVAGVALVLVAGDRLFKKRQKLFFVGGLGLLYYTMNNKV